MQEHEVKILEIDEIAVIKSLEKLGGIKVFDGEMNSIYYRSILGDLVRIRKKGDKSYLTLKVENEREGMKINEEHKAEIGDFNEVKMIIEKLGLKEFSKDFRKRKSYKLAEGTIEINKYEEIPAFLEIETDSPEKLHEIVGKLGFNMSQTKAWSGKDVLNYYEKQKTK